MPQMKPMNWIFILTFTLTVLALIIILLHFFLMPPIKKN